MAKRLVDGLTDRFQSKSKRQALGFWSSFPASFAMECIFQARWGYVRLKNQENRQSELENSAHGNMPIWDSRKPARLSSTNRRTTVTSICAAERAGKLRRAQARLGSRDRPDPAQLGIGIFLALTREVLLVRFEALDPLLDLFAFAAVIL